ncbi:MAG: hypothetical protein DME45_06795 [Verrucomicrobia bacterium]|nr:MAG: hypothetical protein DME45_06795 [Verrucomicrobiota bacterium]
MTETQIGIANPAVIDLFAVDQKSGDVLLVMNEARPWTGGDEQLHELQEKFNTYASFILDGEMTEAHQELKGRAARIELRCRHLPSDEALALLQVIHDQLELQAIKVEVVVASEIKGSIFQIADCNAANRAASTARRIHRQDTDGN